ncbi:MAG: phage antirepressor KilAC domain-containing protein, partial [Armatimonadia bacterium]
PDERGLISTYISQGRSEIINAVTEAGLYALVFGSRKEEAHEFKRWVAHEVLPAIRKHGMYATPATVEAMLADPDTMIATLTALKDERAARVAAQEQLAIAAPKVECYDRLMSSDGCMSIGEVAKVLGTGQNRLFSFLRARNILKVDNIPYQEHIDAKRFRVIEQTWTERGTGTVHPSAKTLVTAKGLDYIRKLWDKAVVA